MTSAVDRFVEHAKAFRIGNYRSADSPMPRLAAGQSPKVLVISCMDSRVDPAMILGIAPGEALVIRNVANLVPPFTRDDKPGTSVRAAVQFAVGTFGVQDIIVMGHSGCGGIRAMIDMKGKNDVDYGFVGHWMESGMSACDHVLADGSEKMVPDNTHAHLVSNSRCVEMRSITNSITNLKSYPWVQHQLRNNALNLHGMWFDIADGRLWTLDTEHGVFRPVEES